MSGLPTPDTLSVTLGGVAATDAFGLGIWLDGAECTQTVFAAGPGLFRTRRRADDAVMAVPGAKLPNGAILGFLQWGPLLFPVTMPQEGWVLAAAPEGAQVQYGSPLFRILHATKAILS